MKKNPPLFCTGCGIQIPNRTDRQGTLCRPCQINRRCSLCGQILPATGGHTCASVDLKGERYCLDCGKLLNSSGYERWKTRCGACEKKRFRERERALRAELRLQFGGKCQRCSYSRCAAALHFHHNDASEKYDWSGKGNGSASLREITLHPERFELVCANCHIEIHHPLDHGL